MKIGMLFPGYGSQFVGMAKELYDNSRTIQEYFEQASQCLDINFIKLCYASSELEMNKLNNAYAAIFLLGVSIAEMILKTLNIKLDLVAGYGSGEYSALCVAGGISFADGLYLLKKLSYFYTIVRQELDVKTVMIEGISVKDLKQICKESSTEDNLAQISVYSKESENIVSGHTNAVENVIEDVFFKGAGKVTCLEIEEALHTPILKDLFDQLKLYLTKVDFKDLKTPMISCIGGKEITTSQSAQNVIISQIVKPIYWKNVLKKFSDIDLIIVPSPSKVLVEEIKLLYKDKIVIGIETLQDITNLKLFLENSKQTDEQLNSQQDNNQIGNQQINNQQADKQQANQQTIDN